jgi:hypothetical protein
MAHDRCPAATLGQVVDEAIARTVHFGYPVNEEA